MLNPKKAFLESVMYDPDIKDGIVYLTMTRRERLIFETATLREIDTRFDEPVHEFLQRTYEGRDLIFSTN